MGTKIKIVRRSELNRRSSIPYKFGEPHKEYIRACRDCTYNILEGAVRSGKTIDNVFAFAHELKRTPDKIHLASGSTLGNAKMNIGDANGFGLEWIFRGQCRWGKYKGMEALIIQGPDTNFRQRIVIFAGSFKADSYKAIRGNSYGMWIATEINLHHDNFIKEAFNRQLAAVNRKIFWDLNPEHPKAPIYKNYIDVYAEKAAAGTLLGGYNYRHFDIFQNATIPPQRLQEIISQYDEGSIWYIRDILGQRTIAEGLIYQKIATSIAAHDKRFFIPAAEAKRLAAAGKIIELNVGIDFGGNGSGHAFVATGMTEDYEQLIILRSQRFVEGEKDPETGRRLDDIDPDKLSELFIRFYERILRDYGFVTRIYADSAEQVLIRGIRKDMNRAEYGETRIENAAKCKIIDRIRTVTTLAAQNRLFYTEECETFEQAVSMAVWNPKKIELERLDDGTSDIDTMDAFEYTFERRIPKLLSNTAWEVNRDSNT
jgi:Terminase-like family.